jgi:hypothetical protein
MNFIQKQLLIEAFDCLSLDNLVAAELFRNRGANIYRQFGSRNRGFSLQPLSSRRETLLHKIV